MGNPYFSVWAELNGSGWRFTLWSGNGAALFQSSRKYTTKRGAVGGCNTVMSCFAPWCGGSHKEIFDTDGKQLN